MAPILTGRCQRRDGEHGQWMKMLKLLGPWQPMRDTEEDSRLSWWSILSGFPIGNTIPCSQVPRKHCTLIQYFLADLTLRLVREMPSSSLAISLNGQQHTGIGGSVSVLTENAPRVEDVSIFLFCFLLFLKQQNKVLLFMFNPTTIIF